MITNVRFDLKPPLAASTSSVRNASPISKRLEVQGITPILGDVSPLVAALPKGTGVYIPPWALRRYTYPLTVLSTGVSAPGKVSGTSPVAPVAPAATVLSPPAKPDRPPWSITQRWEEAKFSRKVASKGVGVMLLTHSTTQAQVANPLITAGLHPDAANGMASAALNFVHSHGFTAALVGFSVAGGVAFIDSFIRPGKQRKRPYGWYATAGIVGAFLFYFFTSSPNPFRGTWTLEATQSRYESGDPPREATCKIEEKGGGLAVSEDDVFPNGKVAHISYHLELDGKDHRAQDGATADTMRSTLTKNTLETIFRKGGQIVSRETRVLSADQKLMTVTLSGVKSTKQEFKNISVYEKK